MSGEVSVPLLPIQVPAPAGLYTQLTKDALAAGRRSIAAFEAERGCGFGLDSPPHQRVWLSICLLFPGPVPPSALPASLSSSDYLINSPPLPMLFVCTLAIPSCSALWYLFALDFCWWKGLYFTTAQLLTFLVVALFSFTLNLLLPSAPLPFISRILYRQNQHLLLQSNPFIEINNNLRE